MPIASFRCRDTAQLFSGSSVRRFRNFETAAMRKLAMLNAASELNDLRVPPGNHLELLQGNRSGQHSIRVNGQFRLCFRWSTAGPEDVEICDYH